MEDGKEYYKEKMIKMIEEINDISIIKLLYYYVSSGYNEEKAGKQPCQSITK